MSESVQDPTSQPQRVRQRVLHPDGSFNVERVGLRFSPWDDLYFHLICIPLPLLLAVIFLLFTILNTFCALLYLAGGDCIIDARAGSFADAFFFSVQTMAAVGYGVFSPATLYAHIVASCEALVGLIGFALFAGGMFARISRPSARIIFCKHCVVSTYHGTPTLMVRIANRRLNRVLEASVQIALLRHNLSSEGIAMRRFHTLNLVRSQTPFFGPT